MNQVIRRFATLDASDAMLSADGRKWRVPDS